MMVFVGGYFPVPTCLSIRLRPTTKEGKHGVDGKVRLFSVHRPFIAIAFSKP